MSVPNAAGVETADPGLPVEPPYRPAITQQEANVIAETFDPGRQLDHIQVYWVKGFRGVQPLLQPIHARWVGYLMLALLALILQGVALDGLDIA
ncbi:MAG TPA: hypothetical protein VFI40_04885 [Nocardioides sp.]|nr:hypothetical protein [Nocardioides sp.]